MTAPPRLPYTAYVESVAADVSTLSAVLRATPAHVPVPTCPDWSLGELGAHVGDFAAFYTHAICNSTGATPPPWPNSWRSGSASPLDGQASAEYFDDRAQFLLSLLRATPSEAPVRTWNPEDQTAHFVARRSAHELAVHRVDAQIAAGRREPIEAPLAVDGIEEIFVMLSVFKRMGRAGADPPAGGWSLQIHATDEHTVWVVGLHADEVTVSRQSGVADLTLTGAASDLELLLYGRPTIGNVEQVGDTAVLDSWYRTFTF